MSILRFYKKKTSTSKLLAASEHDRAYLAIVNVLQDAWQCIYPELCLGCNGILNGQEEVLCLKCYSSLDIILGGPDCSLVQSVFWGRVKIDKAYSLLRFSQGSITQKLMHSLKYKGDQKTGIWMGKILAKHLSRCLNSQTWVVVPVPIHPSKLKKRGFNQTEVIAKGMTIDQRYKVDTAAVVRARKGTSLTKLDRNQRSELTKSLYQLHPNQTIHGKNVLLLDDVLTTGATLTSCAQLLQEVGVSQLVICTLAFSEK